MPKGNLGWPDGCEWPDMEWPEISKTGR